MNAPERDPAVTALERLAAELDPSEFVTTLVTGDDHVPFLNVATRNPQLSETIYALDGSFWWSWEERLTPLTDVPVAAARIVAVLHLIPEPARG
jgi:hypothetical protein